MAGRRGRAVLGDLLWRGLQVFLSALLVTTSATEYITRLKTMEFWQEVAGAGIIAALSQLLNYAAIRLGRAEVREERAILERLYGKISRDEEEAAMFGRLRRGRGDPGPEAEGSYPGADREEPPVEEDPPTGEDEGYEATEEDHDPDSDDHPDLGDADEGMGPEPGQADAAEAEEEGHSG